MPITGAEAILNVCGDFHYGADGMTDKNEIIDALNAQADAHRGNIFRVFTGDLIENSLKTSVGHNYDVGISDPAEQKADMIDILTDTNRYLYGCKAWNSLSVSKLSSKSTHEGILSVGVEGNHEYRTRKLAGQWISSEMFNASKVLDLKINAIIELTIYNKKLKAEMKYKMFISHRLSKTNGCSSEAVLRGFMKKQSTLPGIDLIVIGHTHKRFIAPGSYTNTDTGELRKVLYVVNPSPMQAVEYAQEAGYPPLEAGYFINVHLPLDSAAPIWGTV